MFSKLEFHLDEDVHPNVAELIIDHGGVITENNGYFVINQRTDDIPLNKRVVYQNWINKCVSQRGIVDANPFLVEGRVTIKRQKVTHVLYSEEDDRTLLMYGRRYPDENKQTVWERAEKEELLPNRTALSMYKRYRQLKQKLERVHKRYTSTEDESLIAWVWSWKNLNHPSKDRIWTAAEKNNVIRGRTAEQLKSHYTQLRKKGKHTNVVLNQVWSSYFTQEK